MTATVTTRIIEHYQLRREVSQPPDLATLLLARLVYTPPARRTQAIATLEQSLQDGTLTHVNGNQAQAFTRWLYHYLVINRTVKGVSFYPIHPALALSTNAEGSRVEAFIEVLALSFTQAERDALLDALWTRETMPAFEQLLYDIIEWQLPPEGIAPPADVARFAASPVPVENPTAGAQILQQAKADLLCLAKGAVGVQSFISHSGRLLALHMSRYLLAQAGVGQALPIYAAPAADSHEGVKTLAHEIIEIHRAEFAQVLEKQFKQAVAAAQAELGRHDDPDDEPTAREIIKRIFHSRANVIPPGKYQSYREIYGSIADMAYYYYWTQGYARGRFLRQLHATHLNLAKKAGYANSRSRYSAWHFYWLSPSLVETLLLVTQASTGQPRMLVNRLLRLWQERYGLAVTINESWQDVYNRSFRALGNPESLNEANLRRFNELLAERGRLYKNSDDFPWVILRD
jgi:hypothetical protein